MHKKLTEIISKTKIDLSKRKKIVPISVILSKAKDLLRMQDVSRNRPFIDSMIHPKYGKVAIIAEVKLASPSSGELGVRDDIANKVKQYEKAGVDAISIVTEKHFFKGDPSMVGIIKRVTSLPILQKDFVIDEYQIFEAKMVKADAILLIARIVDGGQLKKFVNLSKKMNIEPVVEINSNADLKKALNTSTKIVAVNARDLDNFKVDVDRACQLLKQIPDQFIKLGFSGITKKEDTEKYQKAGAKGVLVGTSLMKSKNIPKFLERIRV